MRYGLLAAALLAAAPSISLAADPMAAHKAFVGWTSGDAPSWHATGTHSYGALRVAFTEAHRGIAFKDTTTGANGLMEAAGFNGRMAWATDENNFLRLQLGRAAQTQIALEILRSENLAQFNPTVAGHSTYNGQSVSILHAQPSGLPPIDVYESDATGAYVRAVVAPGQDERVIDDIGYTQVGNRHILSSWRVLDGDYSLTNFDVTRAVSDADLSPGQSPQWSIDTKPIPIVLDTSTDNSRLVRVEASVNGHRGIFTLSTGAPSIILFSDFAAQAGVQDAGVMPWTPYSGNINFAGFGRARDLSVGNSTIHNVVVARFNTPPSNHMAGILGYDFFANAVVNVDLSKSQLSLSDPNTPATPGNNGYAFPIDLSTRTPVTTLMLTNGVAHPQIDTSLTGFILASQTLRDTGRITGHDIASSAAVTYSGFFTTGDPLALSGLDITYTDWHSTTSTGRCVEADELQIGPYRYTKPPVCFAGSNIFGSDGGAVGMDFLRHFNWSVDYPHQKFVVTPNGN